MQGDQVRETSLALELDRKVAAAFDQDVPRDRYGASASAGGFLKNHIW